MLSLKLSHIVNQLRKILCLVLAHSWWSKSSRLLNFSSDLIAGCVIKRARRVLFSWTDYFLFISFVIIVGLLIFITLSNLFFAGVLSLIRVIALNLIRLKILLWIYFAFFTNIWLLYLLAIIILILSLLLIWIKWMVLIIWLLSISRSLIKLTSSLGAELLIVTLWFVWMLKVWTCWVRLLVLFEIWSEFFLGFMIC